MKIFMAVPEIYSVCQKPFFLHIMLCHELVIEVEQILTLINKKKIGRIYILLNKVLDLLRTVVLY
jgi:hypothetical protein